MELPMSCLAALIVGSLFMAQTVSRDDPGVRIIEASDASPGPTPETYAFSRETTQRNLYRIPIP